MRKIGLIQLLLLLALFVGCAGRALQSTGVPGLASTVSLPLFPAVSCPVVDDAEFINEVTVYFDNDRVVISALPQGVESSLDGANVTLRSSVAGVHYKVSGSATNASLTIVSEWSPLVTLSDLSLTSAGCNTLQVSSLNVIYLRSVGVNMLGDSEGDVPDKQAAVIKLMGRAVLAGNGSLSLTASRGTALLSTDVLFVTGSDISVLSAPKNAILANNALVVAGGNLNLSSTKDIVKVKGGYCHLSGGVLGLNSTGEGADAIQANDFYMSGGVLNANVSGAVADGIKTKGLLYIAGGTVSVVTSGDALYSEKKFDYSSASCFKSDSCIYITGGALSLESNGAGAKGISCDGSTYITGGAMRVVTRGNDVVDDVDLNAHTSCKGIKSDSTLLFCGGTVEVLVLGRGERAEGIESKGEIVVEGNSDIYIYAYDDAVNVGKGFIMNGGRLFAYSVANDAVDSNDFIEINGGVLVADGSFIPEQGIDADVYTRFTLRGGTVFSVGGSMGPSSSLPLAKNTAATVLSWSGLDLKKGDYIMVADADGSGILSYQLTRDNAAGTLLVSAPGIGKNKNIQLSQAGTLAGATAMGRGLFAGGTPVMPYNCVTFKTKALVCVVTAGNVEYIDPDTVTTAGMMMLPMPPGGFTPPPGGFPPPPQGAAGSFMAPPPGFGSGFPPPPQGGFPPPMGSRVVESEYGEDNLPHYK